LSEDSSGSWSSKQQVREDFYCPLSALSFCHSFITEEKQILENVAFISEFAMDEDSPILAVELDVDELAKGHKAS